MPPLQTTVVQMLNKYLYSIAILIMSQQCGDKCRCSAYAISD